MWYKRQTALKVRKYKLTAEIMSQSKYSRMCEVACNRGVRTLSTGTHLVIGIRVIRIELKNYKLLPEKLLQGLDRGEGLVQVNDRKGVPELRKSNEI